MASYRDALQRNVDQIWPTYLNQPQIMAETVTKKKSRWDQSTALIPVQEQAQAAQAQAWNCDRIVNYYTPSTSWNYETNVNKHLSTWHRQLEATLPQNYLVSGSNSWPILFSTWDRTESCKVSDTPDAPWDPSSVLADSGNGSDCSASDLQSRTSKRFRSVLDPNDKEAQCEKTKPGIVEREEEETNPRQPISGCRRTDRTRMRAPLRSIQQRLRRKKPVNVVKQGAKRSLTVEQDTYSRVRVNWEGPVAPSNGHNLHLRLEATDGKDESVSWPVPAKDSSFHIPHTLEAGRYYTVTLCGDSGNLITAGFRAELSQADLSHLRNRAAELVGEYAMAETMKFYRNKPDAYFNEILYGGGLMRPHLKDNNGDPASPINGRLTVLFFCASVHRRTGAPFHNSPFGPRRLLVDAADVMQHFPNIYFADFYCYSQKHYVSLIVTKDDSWSDKFCNNKLVLLNPRTNPFLRVTPTEVLVASSDDVIVEVMVTEEMNIAFLMREGLAYFTSVDTIERGTSIPGGIPKNPECTICNISPRPPV